MPKILNEQNVNILNGMGTVLLGFPVASGSNTALSLILFSSDPVCI